MSKNSVKKTRLIIIRHAEAFGNYLREFHGWTDSEITKKGHIQAKRLADRMKDERIDVIYSSTMKRTMQTASYIAEVKELPIIRTDKLKEINGGDWEGKTWDELPHRWPKEYQTWENTPHLHRMPNGESMEEFTTRLKKELDYIIQNNSGKSICVVTHGTAIKTLMCVFRKLEPERIIDIAWYDNTSVTMLDYENGEYDVIMEGDTSHLGKEYSTIENQEWWEEYKKRFSK
jgi:broad specificity phosphatase PhoE